jgi:hypothetical protein
MAATIGSATLTRKPTMTNEDSIAIRLVSGELRVNVHPFVHGGFCPYKRRKVALACCAIARSSRVFPSDELLGNEMRGAIRGGAVGDFSVIELIRCWLRWEAEKHVSSESSDLVALLCRAIFSIWLADFNGLPLKGGPHCADYPELIAHRLEANESDDASEKLRCIFWGMPPRFASAHRRLFTTSQTAFHIARQIEETEHFGTMPILADALEDAGYKDADLLDHWRRPGPHALGCGAVDAVLNRSECHLSRLEINALFHKHLFFLTQEETTAFTLRWYDLLSQENVAAAMGLSESASEEVQESLWQKLRLHVGGLVP